VTRLESNETVAPMRIFLAAPFTQLIETRTGIVDAAWRTQLCTLFGSLQDQGHSVFLAHERESWGEELMTPEECTPLDFREMVKADVVCAYLGNPPSHGVHIELGWASALGKPIVLLIDEDVRYTPLVWGIAGVTHTEFFHLAGRPLHEVADEVCVHVAKMCSWALLNRADSRHSMHSNLIGDPA
jgi:nucleoside 2-deoxyribosyltransferase